jgi:hypothetical protein
MEKMFHKPRDFFGGGLVIAIGVGFLLTGRELDMGTTFRMGPGYFPTMLSMLLIALGIGIIVQAWRGEHLRQDFDGVPWKAALLITAAVVLFGAFIRNIGLFPAVAGVALLTASISRFSNLKTTILLAIGLALACILVFTYLLGLPLPMIGKWLTLAYWQR